MAFEGGLPEELMTLILVKLPVKCLLQCKCVRKSWYALIKSPQFIRIHHRSSSSSSPQLIIRRSIDEGDEPRHVLSLHSYETFADLGNGMNIPFSNDEVSLSDPYDGLVCITNNNDQIFICNPATRELRSLFVPPSFGDVSGYHVDSVAFGADPNTAGKYKVVMIGVPYDNSAFYDPEASEDELANYTPQEDRFGDREVTVYDFSTDSWRDTAVVIPGPFNYSLRAVSLNGAFHWCPETWRQDFMYADIHDILTFHISDEVTQSIPMPDFVSSGQFKELCVSSNSQLSLVVMVWGEDVDLRGRRFEISVMTEYGVKESWTRLFQIGPLIDINVQLSFWDEQQLLLVGKEGQLVSCDLQHQNHLRSFPIYDVLDMYPYSQSLVSVNLLP